MSNVKNMQIGARYGMWRVMMFSHISEGGRAMWLCECDCGTVRAVDGYSLRSGASTGCGCTSQENMIKAHIATAKHHGKNERLYGIWCGIKDRCYNKNSPYYYRYGGRGITVCDAWKSDYASFREWAIANGYGKDAPKSRQTLDRLNNDLGYSPGNCAWRTMKQQSNNRASNRIIECDGEKHTMAEWAEMLGLNRSAIAKRIDKYGWSVERAVTTRNTRK